MTRQSAPASPERWTLVRRARQLITLRGADGPRHGSGLSELGIVSDGAILIRNGVVEEYGASRRVENLAQAREAREVDASGKIVMPAFIDADTVLAYPRFASRRLSEHPRETPIRLFSKHRLEAAVASAAAECVRSGVLTVGAHTGYAIDLRDTVKVLRTHHALQGKPLRIRSILSPRQATPIEEKWLIAARKKKFAGFLDIPGTVSPAEFHATAMEAVRRNYGIRIRSAGRLADPLLKAVVAAGGVTVISPPTYDNAALAALSRVSGFHLINICCAFDSSGDHAGAMRHEIERGVSVALASGYNIESTATGNPQHILHLATTRLGMTLAEALNTLIWNAACALRVSQFAGSFEPGKPADLIIVDVPDYRELPRRAGHNDVAVVMRQGRTVYRRAGLTLD